MKFRFCSDGDCPLWVQAAMGGLESVPELLLRRIVKSEIIDRSEDDGLINLFKSCAMPLRDNYRQNRAAICWVMYQSWRSECPGEHLAQDLQLLGAPKLQATIIAEAVDQYRDHHVAQAQRKQFTVPKATDASLAAGSHDADDSLKLSLATDNAVSGEQKTEELLLEKTKAEEILVELKKADEQMDALENN